MDKKVLTNVLIVVAGLAVWEMFGRNLVQKIAPAAFDGDSDLI